MARLGSISSNTLVDTSLEVDSKIDSAKIVYNVKDYGALGDGLTDDTAAIQNTLDTIYANGGGICFLPEGVYLVDPDISIHVPENIELLGVGRTSEIKVKDNSDVLDNLIKVENADGVIIKDIAVDGNRSNQDASDLVAVHYGIYIASSNNCRIENVYVHDTTGVGVHVYDSVGTVVINSESEGNRYHGFECEQATSCIFANNRGHDNSRHGIFISPGEVGGTGSIGNVIVGNSFDNNDSYGIALGIDAAGSSIGLTKDNLISNNSCVGNAEYGISIYRVDDTVVSDNIVAYNGFFGIYLYRAERNQVTSNRLRNNSQSGNGAYAEILLEGASDGQASQHNLISDNFIMIDGANKANWAIREATNNDGPNVITNNYIPNAGTSGRVSVQHTNTRYSLVSDTPSENRESLRTFDKGLIIAPNSTLPGGVMGFDAPFGNAAFRMYTDVGNLQYVATSGNADWYLGGNNTFSVTSSYVSTHGYKIQDLGNGVSPTDAVNKGQLDTAIANIIDSSPTTLDTLNELAAALGDDPNFATTITTLIGTKANDNAVVHLAGTETVTGLKEFSMASGGLRFYNTADQVTNYERVAMGFSSNIFAIDVTRSGSGVSNRAMRLSTAAGSLGIASTSTSGVFNFTGTAGSVTPSFAQFNPTYTQTSGSNNVTVINPTINQSGTASYTALLINPTETSTGSGSKRLLDLQVGGSSKLSFDNLGNTTHIDGANLIFGTATGTKIGTATSQKIGFYNATPIIQPTAVADATGTTASVQTQLNLLLTRLRALGLIAT